MRFSSKTRGRKRFFFLIIFLFALVFFLITFFWTFFSGSSWDGERRLTVVFNVRPLAIISLEPRTSRGIVVILPANTFLEVPFGYGKYFASSVFALGELEKKNQGGKLLARAIEQSLGIWIDGYIHFQNFSSSLFEEEEFRLLKKKIFSFRAIPSLFFVFFSNREKITTDLSFFDLFRFWYSLARLKSHQISYLNLEKKNVLIPQVLPDEAFAYQINKEIVDSAFGNEFEDFFVRRENLSIKVINSTNEEKLAANVSFILKNLGANVVGKGNSLLQYEGNCLLQLKEKNFQKAEIVKRLKNHYHCQINEDKSLSEEADCQIVLGEKFTKLN